MKSVDNKHKFNKELGKLVDDETPISQEDHSHEDEESSQIIIEQVSDRPLHRADIDLLDVDLPIDAFQELNENRVPFETQIPPYGFDVPTGKELARDRWRHAFVVRYDGLIREVSAKELDRAYRTLPDGLWWGAFLDWGFYCIEEPGAATHNINNCVNHVPLELRDKLRTFIVAKHVQNEGLVKTWNGAEYRADIDHQNTITQKPQVDSDGNPVSTLRD